MKRPDDITQLGFELESVVHFPQSPWAYGADKKTVHIRLRTKKGNVHNVKLMHQDPFAGIEASTLSPAIKRGSDSLFDYWLSPIVPPNLRLQYTFVLERHNPDEVIYFNETGFHITSPQGGHFVFSYLHECDLYCPPEWVKDTVWYQIFPERFANGDPSLNPPETLPWGSTDPTRANYFGGDFQGVIDHMDYIISLGITGIYLTPVFLAKSNHKYDTIDYLELDPQFGTKETFRKMVDLFHKNSIRVMLDCVFNHSGEFFKPFQDVKKNQEKSKYKDWFHIHSFPLKTNPANYQIFAFCDNMPKLNTRNPETKEYLIKVATYWIKEFNIDGWRLDVGDEVDHNLWKELTSEVRKIKPDCFVIGETWHNAIMWIAKDQWDSCMNYPILSIIDELFAKNGKISKFTGDIINLLHWYPETVNKVMFNFADSHDTPRLMTRVENNETKYLLIWTFLLTYIGTPCIYYGDEIGMDGSQDPFNRKCMVWDKSKQNLKIFSTIQKLIKIRKNNKQLTDGNFEFLEMNDELNYFSYRRFCIGEEDEVVVVINLGTSDWFPTLFGKKTPQRIVDLLNDDEVLVDFKGISVSPNSAKILRLEM